MARVLFGNITTQSVCMVVDSSSLIDMELVGDFERDGERKGILDDKASDSGFLTAILF